MLVWSQERTGSSTAMVWIISGVFTIEEGDIDEEGILENPKRSATNRAPWMVTVAWRLTPRHKDTLVVSHRCRETRASLERKTGLLRCTLRDETVRQARVQQRNQRNTSNRHVVLQSVADPDTRYSMQHAGSSTGSPCPRLQRRGRRHPPQRRPAETDPCRTCYGGGCIFHHN